MPVLEQSTMGRLQVSTYDFAVAGEVLSMHTHSAANDHISIVARGRFHVHGPGWQRVLACGDVVDWPDGDTHEFIALDPGARLVNIVRA